MPSSDAAMPLQERALSWLHIGDLHLEGRDADNHRALLRIVGEANAALAGRVDFCILPGDLAEHGTSAQYALLHEAIAGLRIPVHAIPGDHDFHGRSLDAFYAATGSLKLPQMAHIRGHCCLFLDMVSAGSGGPDFRLGAAQLEWVGRKLHAAQASDHDSVVFMHAYPADLADPLEAAALRRLFARHNVVCVDMGHTHYNELANDGRTIYAATRSTGQIEEGAVGFSVASVDAGGVSWRFREVASAWPLVLVTAPVDRRLLTTADDLPTGQRPSTAVRALAWSTDPVVRCACRVDDGPWQEMARSEDSTQWTGHIASPETACRLTVCATDRAGRSDEHGIELAGPDFAPPPHVADGSDADRIDAWPEIGLLGTQLGPNRNGRKR